MQNESLATPSSPSTNDIARAAGFASGPAGPSGSGSGPQQTGGGGTGGIAIQFGSAPDNDFVHAHPHVAPYHARVVWDGTRLLLQDLQAPAGTWLNGQRVSTSPVQPGDQIGLGQFVFPLDPNHMRRLQELRAAASSGGGYRGQVQTAQAPSAANAPRMTGGPEPSPAAQSISMGYSDDNVVVVTMPQVSGNHARLWKDGARFILEDLGSTNGTYLNGERVQRAWVKLGDQIGLGSYSFPLSETIVAKFDSQKAVEQRTQIGQLPPGLVKPIKVGRDPEAGVNDIVIDAPMVSNEHCQLQFIGTGWRVTDLGSTNGTYINNRDQRISEGVATANDVLFFGSYRFPLSRIADFIGGPQTTKGDKLTLPTDKPVMLVGRDESCDVVIDSAQVSREHLRLTRTPTGFVLEDLGSANGTFVNGKRVKRAEIGPDDWVGLGSYQIKFNATSGKVTRNYHGDIILQADGITWSVEGGKKTILHDVSFTAYPTEFVGLMGPSGAGKTSLMMALNGYVPPTSGRSLINGLDLYQNYNAFRGNIGYVPQDDIIHHELTVWEALYYTAKLRLPPDTTDAEIERIISRVLERLEIGHTRDVLIGSPEKKGISGGQRKRVNLAQELITEPSLLFLDEPTSGLASEDTINVMRMLRKLADDGATILLTIHQPSLEAYRAMDNIVYMADGHLVYYGPTYPDSISYFNDDALPGTPEGDRKLSDPSWALKPLAEDKRRNKDMKLRAETYKQSKYNKEYVERRKTAATSEVQLKGGTKQKTRRKFGLRQWWVLSRRYATIKRKDIVNTAILLMQAPVIGGLISAVFWDATDTAFERVLNTPFALFLLVVAAIWFGCSNSAREIVAEQAIYKRERMVNLKNASYVMSKFAVLGVVCAVQCIMLLIITVPFLDFSGSVLEMFGVLLTCSLAGLGMGLLLSSLVRTSEAAIALVPLLLIPQVILGGILMPIDELNAPTWGLSSVMISRWGYEALLHSEDRHGGFDLSDRDLEKQRDRYITEQRKEGKDVRNLTAPPPPENPIDKFFGESETSTGTAGGVLAVFNFLMLFGVLIVLKFKDPDVG